MRSYGLLARRGGSGLWRRTHDLAGTDWDLVLPMADALARHLLETGMLCGIDDAPADTLHPGVVITPSGVEARLAMRHPATTFARTDDPLPGLLEEGAPKPLADLWSSDPRIPQSLSRRTT